VLPSRAGDRFSPPAACLWWSWVTPGVAGRRRGGEPVWRVVGCRCPVLWFRGRQQPARPARHRSSRHAPPDAPLRSATFMVNRTPRASALDQKEHPVQLTMKPTHPTRQARRPTTRSRRGYQTVQSWRPRTGLRCSSAPRRGGWGGDVGVTPSSSSGAPPSSMRRCVGHSGSSAAHRVSDVVWRQS